MAYDNRKVVHAKRVLRITQPLNRAVMTRLLGSVINKGEKT